ncbi:hypothetical protein BZY95_01650 [Billgrantia desiderata SP1]|uniref:hypothetical protein n=1 Tax=Billgrantia desiderata TaxID=52021 RepID=UPI000A396D1A|nr:hypothetical protein [Halomonas desiderata]OUE46563.1 hypothetical protein BZY95_01650 [Halomonas desiderata SP1]
MKDKSQLEKVTNNLGVRAAGTAVGILGATITPLAAFVPFLLDTLASGRQAKRLEAAFIEIEHVLKKHESLINEMTDDQYKVINEAVSSALYTINQEKLSYLVQVVNNAAQEGSYCQGASDHLSRVIRDISADEILFLLRSVQYEGVAVTDSDVKNDTLLKIPPGSHDELLMTGLLHLGLVFAKDSTWNFQVYKWSPIVRNLIALLESNNQ